MLTLRHLHTTGVDCTTDEEARTPWRRWFHHCTFYGFLLCFASTSVAAVYHTVFGWQRAVRVHEPAGGARARRAASACWLARRDCSRCAAAATRRCRERQRGLDESFIALFW